MSDCGCIYVDVDEEAALYRSKMQRARKVHRCDECRRPIVRGEEYEHTTICFEGCWNRHKTCVDCVSIRKAFFCHGWEFNRIWEYLNEHIQATDGQISSDCLLALTPSAREDVLDRIDAYWAQTNKGI